MKLYIAALLSLGIFLMAGLGAPVWAESGIVNISASVPGCGDALIQVGEDCDGANLDDKTCQTQGFSSGTLSCYTSCLFNTSQCTSGGGGGGSVSGGSSSGFLSYFLPPLFLPPAKFSPIKADINEDGKVDLVDLSILLYHYNKVSQTFAKYDFNEDGKVDIIDISILLYYWTE